MFTVVTGFFDIGREEWGQYSRSLKDYFKHFKNLLSLRINMVIFIEQKHYDFVEKSRGDIPCETYIIPTKLEELHMYRYLDTISRIQNLPEYSRDHPNKAAPEICQPLYTVVTCSKMDMLARATTIVPKCDYFIWLDAGYTHSTMDLSKMEWNPTQILKIKDKLSVIALQPLSVAKDDPREFFKQYVDVLIGGFLGGSRDVVLKIRDMYYELVVELFKEGLKDDDQFYNTILAKRHPELFQVFYSTWYGAMFLK